MHVLIKTLSQGAQCFFFQQGKRSQLLLEFFQRFSRFPATAKGQLAQLRVNMQACQLLQQLSPFLFLGSQERGKVPLWQNDRAEKTLHVQSCELLDFLGNITGAQVQGLVGVQILEFMTRRLNSSCCLTTGSTQVPTCSEATLLNGKIQLYQGLGSMPCHQLRRSVVSIPGNSAIERNNHRIQQTALASTRWTRDRKQTRLIKWKLVELNRPLVAQGVHILKVQAQNSHWFFASSWRSNSSPKVLS